MTVRLVRPPLAEIGVARDKLYRRVQPVFHRKRVISLPQLASNVALVRVDVRLRASFAESSVSPRRFGGVDRHVVARASSYNPSQMYTIDGCVPLQAALQLSHVCGHRLPLGASGSSWLGWVGGCCCVCEENERVESWAQLASSDSCHHWRGLSSVRVLACDPSETSSTHSPQAFFFLN